MQVSTLHDMNLANPAYHPWRLVRDRPQIDVIWPEIEIFGQTDGMTIQLDPRLSQVERRCVVTHELDHIEQGHTCGQAPAVEWAVRQRVARKLIHHSILAQSLAYNLDLDAVAADCWVTREVLDDRFEGLTIEETRMLRTATTHHRDTA